MTVYDLNRDQLIELKQRYLMDTSADGNVSYDEMADADELVSDEEIFKASRHLEFVPDDFFCSAGEDDCWAFTLRDNPVYGSKEDVADILMSIAQDIRNGAVSGRIHAISWKMERDNW